ncbi:hypothetical protein D051_3508 [Vibrio parahaemolyticus VPCR-2010]|nr:hypothetical protein D051_3508 [Vibrio parahaemolyticus VPCR-2010]
MLVRAASAALFVAAVHAIQSHRLLKRPIAIKFGRLNKVQLQSSP